MVQTESMSSSPVNTWRAPFRAMGLGAVAMAGAICLAWPGNSSAQDFLPPSDIPGEFSANVALSTDYIYRGVTQSDHSPALSGGFDYSLPTGAGDSAFYVGVWGSNIEQTYNYGDETGATTTANIELDIYGGLSGSLPVADGLGWDIGAIHYKYPGVPSASKFDFTEVYGGLGYDFGLFSLEASVAYSPDYFSGIGPSLYASSAATIPVYKSFYVGGGFGRLMSLKPNDGKSFEQISDWHAGGGLTLLGLDWSVTYYDTKSTSNYGSTVVGAVAASF